MFRFRRTAGSKTTIFRYQDFNIHLLSAEELPRDVRGWYGLRTGLSRIDSAVVQTFDHPFFVRTLEEAQALSLEFARKLIDDRYLACGMTSSAEG
jgi:hypothetical protein